MRRLILATAIAASASATAARAETTIQTRTPQDVNFPSQRLSCSEWDRCEAVPGFRMGSSQGFSRGGGGAVYGPTENYAVPEYRQTEGGMSFVRTYQKPF